MADKDEVQRIEAALHREGWADHTSLAWELRAWERLAAEVNAYAGTVDDYTNALCSRDYLALMAARASRGLREEIDQQVAPIDDSCRGATLEDADGRLARFFNTDRKDSWWRRRRPPACPLADYLSHGN